MTVLFSTSPRPADWHERALLEGYRDALVVAAVDLPDVMLAWDGGGPLTAAAAQATSLGDRAALLRWWRAQGVHDQGRLSAGRDVWVGVLRLAEALAAYGLAAPGDGAVQVALASWRAMFGSQDFTEVVDKQP